MDKQEAIQIIKSHWPNNHHMLGEALEFLIPELKESEDEKIRKCLIDYFSNFHLQTFTDIDPKKILVWLEKQGEQKPITIDIDKMVSKYSHTKDGDFGLPVNCQIRAYRQGINDALNLSLGIKKQGEQKPYGQREECLDCQFNYAGECKGSCQMKRGEQKPTDKVEPKFYEGEWITNGDYTWKIVEVKPLDYILQSQEGNIVDDTISHVNEQFHSFTIKDAKAGDVLVNWNNTVFIFKTVEDETVKFHIAYNEKWDEIKTPSTKFSHLGLPESQFKFHPATKEQRDTLMKAMADAGYTFDFEKKELKKIEQNPAWSEEDKEMYGCALAMVEWYEGEYKKKVGLVSNWLKSLKDRVQPQPKQEWGEEDEGFLNLLLAVFTNEHPNGIFSTGNIPVFKGNLVTSNRIIEWLKSLRPHNRWKPSDEQMKALWNVYQGGQEQAELATLYNDLKKLRGE